MNIEEIAQGILRQYLAYWFADSLAKTIAEACGKEAANEQSEYQTGSC